ncbi:MAG: hypothetical protein HRT36_06600 [Alphaproteobacteria bacterium]|nr:hypothetical protein [Alphaproteobacteria bacterium]
MARDRFSLEEGRTEGCSRVGLGTFDADRPDRKTHPMFLFSKNNGVNGYVAF